LNDKKIEIQNGDINLNCLTKLFEIMKKSYFLLFVLTLATFIANAQLVKHFTSADTTVNSWWVNNSQIGYWELTKCTESDEYFALFISDLSKLADEDTLGAWSWATDLKIDTSMSANALDIIADAQSKLFLNFWATAFDGVNAADSIGFSFELLAPDKKGWPGLTYGPVGSDWTWVSLDLSKLDFSGSVASDLEAISMVKFAIQPTVGYPKQEGKFKFALQDITVSKGAAVAPANKPCGSKTSISALKNVSELNFYPNPACSSIRFNQAKTGEIMNLSGSTIMRFANVEELDIKSLKSGVYFVKSGKEVAKLVVK